MLRSHTGAPLCVQDTDGPMPEEKPFSVLHVAFMLRDGVEYVVCTTASGHCPIWSIEPQISQQGSSTVRLTQQPHRRRHHS